MKISPLAGKPAPASMLVNVPRLVTAYYTDTPTLPFPHKGSLSAPQDIEVLHSNKAFNEWHILAISQAICLYREQHQIDGPLFLGMDTHALSVPALASALEVLAANGVEVMLAEGDEYTPTPAISHAILTYNRGRKIGLADGIVITPSHNPPHDGGFKYNPPNGGPAEGIVTDWIQKKANEFLEAKLQDVKRIPFEKALRASTTHRHDYLNTYIADLANVVDMDAIRGAKLQHGCRSPRRRWRPLLGTDCRAIWVEPHGGQRSGRSDLPVYDCGLGWPDPHGPFLGLRDAAIDRDERPL